MFRSIRWNFLAWLSLVLVLVIGGFGGTLYCLVRRSTFQEIDAEIEGAVRVLAESMRRQRPSPPPGRRRDGPPGSGDAEVPREPPGKGPPRGPRPEGAGGGVLAMALGGAWFIVKRTIRPIGAITATAETISASKLSRRIDIGSTERELEKLAQVLNTTFDRLQDAFEKQARFTADASHELRTPVSIILTQAAMARRKERTAEEYREVIEACFAAGKRMKALVDGLLTLARADAGDLALHRTEVDLRQIVEECADLVEPLAAGRRITIRRDLDAAIVEEATGRGLRGNAGITIGGGNLTIDSVDDAIHSNGSITINGGTLSLSAGDDGILGGEAVEVNDGAIHISEAYEGISGGTIAIASGDDAIHADTAVVIGGGSIDISQSYEGIESRSITINDGSVRLVSRDDGINTSDGSGAMSGNWPLYINGGYIAVYGSGDGVDANGPITMTGGTLIVHGPTRNDNGALDYATFKNTGGFVVAAGSSGMAQAPGGQSSTQYAVLVNFRSTLSAGTLFHIRRSDGTAIVTFKSSKSFQSVGFSSAMLARGATYEVHTGGTATGTVVDGLYEGGTYSGGTRYTTFTISNLVTTIRQ